MSAYPKQLLLIALFLLFGGSVSAQCPVMPIGYLCISQAAGNQAAENKRELDATKVKVTVLEDALKEKDKSIEEVRSTAQKNEADLKDRLHKTGIDLATKTGQLIEAEKNNTRNLALIDLLLKGQKKKCQFSIICL